MQVKKLQLPQTPRNEGFDVPKPAAAPGLTGDMPLPVGEVMKPVRYTDAEKAVLEKIGVKEGEAIPVDLAQRLGAVGEKLTQEALSAPQLENRVPLKMPSPVSINDLDEDHREQIRRAIEEAGLKAQATSQDAPSGVKAEQIIEVKNDLESEPSGPMNGAEEKSNKTSPTGLEPFAQTICPHCNWDLSQRDIPDPDEDTKLWYLQAILGNVSFEKTYRLMGGMVELTFRELSQPQNDWIFKQVGKEMKEREDSTVDQFIEQVRRYRLCMQLKEARVGEILYDIPNQGDRPQLPELFELIMQEVLKSVSLVNLATRKADEFNRLISKLEASADRENFWPAA